MPFTSFQFLPAWLDAIFWNGLKRHCVFCDTKTPSPVPNIHPDYSPVGLCFLLFSTAHHPPPHSPTPNPNNDTLKTCGWSFFFYVNLWHYCWLLLSIFCITKRCQWFWINSLLAVGVLLRWDLWLPDPRTECSLRGRGPGQVHWRGSHPSKRQDGLWAAEGAHIHHPGIRLWRGSWWGQHEEVSQVSQQKLKEKKKEYVL